MDAAHWNVVKNIFNEALTLDKELREDFVRNKTIENPELFQTIIDMLRSEDDQDANITEMISSNMQQFISDKFELKSGDKIGAYELDEVIGEGGMGTVFKAHRTDAEYDVNVAIKVIHRKCLNTETLQRFQIERQILANLNHVNIARLIDGGTTENGLPFLVMEYIEGKPIIDFCKQKRLGLNARIHLFLQVCDAVNYAHQNLIVHRDIKPANILVTKEGQIKLLDFGVAKILNPDRYSKSVAETQIEMRILTLENASPEQVLGEKITTRTDVYALGTLLFNLLTEEKIFNLKEQHRLTFEKAICEQLPPKPSTIISDTNSLVNIKIPDRSQLTLNHVKNKLKGDLDNIILKSLQKKPEKRYQSVEQFHDDIIRYLNHYPVKAQPEKISYLTKKYIQRHKFGVAISLVSLISLLAFVSVLSIQNHTIKQQIVMIEKQKTKATNQAERATQVSDFMLDIFTSSDPNENSGKNLTARELLDNGRKQIEKLTTPDIKAKLLETLAQVYQKLGLYQEAIKLIQHSLKLRNSNKDTSGLEKARGYYRLAEIQFDLGLYDVSNENLDKSLEYYVSSDSNDEYEKNSPYIIKAMIYAYQQNYKKATDIDKKTLIIVLNKFTKNSSEAGEAYTNLGADLRHVGELKASEKMLKAGLNARIKSEGRLSLATAHSFNQLASTLSLQERYQEALDATIDGLSIRRSIYKNGHVETAASLGNLAKIYQKLNKLDEAEKARLESIALFRKLVGTEHIYVAGSLNSLGLLLIEKNEYKNAEKAIQESLIISKKIFPANSPRIAYPLTGLGKLYLAQELPLKAIPVLLKAYQYRLQGLPEGHISIATSARFLGEALILSGKMKQGKMYLEKALVIFKNKFGEKHPYVQEVRVLLDKAGSLNNS